MAVIWIDADACPKPIREILFRAEKRTGIRLVLVTNRPLRLPHNVNAKQITVPPGFDKADEEIIDRVEENDLVITADIPLAAAVIEKGAEVIQPNGQEIDAANVGERLSMRNFMVDLRGAGVQTGGPASFGNREKEQFARALEKWLRKAQAS